MPLELGIAHGSGNRDCPYLVLAISIPLPGTVQYWMVLLINALAISTYPYLVPYSTVQYYTGHQYLPLPSTVQYCTVLYRPSVPTPT